MPTERSGELFNNADKQKYLNKNILVFDFMPAWHNLVLRKPGNHFPSTIELVSARISRFKSELLGLVGRLLKVRALALYFKF